jgi:hypothetical protein
MKSMRIRLTRRQITIGLLGTVGGGAAAVWSSSWSDRTQLDLELPPAGNPFNPTYEVFLALSKIVLARPQLDDALARRLYQVFMEEPWGTKHVGHAYAVFRNALLKADQAAGERAPVELSALDAGERWFVAHLVTTWYLGIYYHEQRPTRRITLAGALMYDAVRGVVPIPYHDSIGFGGWTEPPKF